MGNKNSGRFPFKTEAELQKNRIDVTFRFTDSELTSLMGYCHVRRLRLTAAIREMAMDRIRHLEDSYAEEIEHG